MTRREWGVPGVNSALIGGVVRCSAAVFIPPQAAHLRSSHTHACASNNLPRAIHKLDSANKVVSCAVFFFSPR
jgi:hypothetical protein